MYNVQKQIIDLLISLAEIMFEQLQVEILFIDDGSTDNTLRVVNDFMNETGHQRLREYSTIVTGPNRGLSGARNKGLEIAKGEYVWFVDSDDVLRTRAVNQVVLPLIKTKKYDFIQIGYQRFTNLPIKLPDKTIKVREIESKNLFHDLAVGEIENFAWGHIVKKSLMKSFQFFPENRAYEDVATTYRLIESAKHAAVISGVVYLYRYRQGSITSTADVNKITDLYWAVDRIKESASLDISDFGKDNWSLFISRMLMVIYIEMIRSRNQETINIFDRKLRKEICNMKVRKPPIKYKIKYALLSLGLLRSAFEIKDKIDGRK